MKIFINPGHGGADTGACGHGLIERDVALNIGKLVESYLGAVAYDVLLFQFDGLPTLSTPTFLFPFIATPLTATLKARRLFILKVPLKAKFLLTVFKIS